MIGGDSVYLVLRHPPTRDLVHRHPRPNPLRAGEPAPVAEPVATVAAEGFKTMGSEVKTGRAWRHTAAIGIALLVSFLIPAVALAHLERPSYWPNPAPYRSVSPPAGGKVPKARSLSSALNAPQPGDTHVVCKGPHGSKSMNRLRSSIRQARANGYRLRPSEPRRTLKAKRAKKLLRINGKLARKCEFHSIQKAVFEAGNNDRVVIMPGRYMENHSRRQPVNDPRCNPSLLQRDASGDLTPSYAYQAKCPNDGNLIHVQGRAVKGQPVEPPRENRQGIPKQELGRCIQCNLQIEGSGVKPQDVLIDGGKHYENPMKPEAKPGGDTGCEDPEYCYAKHVVMRVDRADGFVARNFLLRGAAEFGFYAEEVDGMLLNRLKMCWAADYGHLSFTTDHHVLKNCDAFGAGDAALYPGAAPETGSQADKSFYPDAPRINTVVKKCDMRGSDLGFSGSMGNSTRITRNDIYGNVSGIVLDTLSAAGHPGFPADSSHIDHNRIYSNNLDLFRPDAPVDPVTPAPMGVGIVYAGMNDARVHHNWIFDNWRNGAMLFAVPDSLTNGGGGRGPDQRRYPVSGSARERHLHFVRQPFLRQPHGPGASGIQVPERDQPVRGKRPQQASGSTPERKRLLVGRLLHQHRQLLVRQHRLRRNSGVGDRSGPKQAARCSSAPPALRLLHQRGHRRPGPRGLPGRVRQRARRGH